MSKKALKRPEVLAPAGNLEKLKIAITYGADAVYIGGNSYSLRARAGNFTYDEIAEGVKFAEINGAKIYVAANMVLHIGDEIGAGDFFCKLKKLGVSAVIISDPALIEICANEAPNLPIHLSTQASSLNCEALKFWKSAGLERVVLGREISLEELTEIRKNVDIEIEVFVHGGMCIAYSGRCVLSNHMSLRDANRGGCSQSCRWKYNLYDLDNAGNQRSSSKNLKEDFSMSSVDLSMIEHIPDLIERGVDSLKIEGRMKSIHYVSTVVNVYKKCVDAYLANPENYVPDQELVEELFKVAQRELSTGFYYDEQGVTGQLFGVRRRIPQYKFVGEVISYDESQKIVQLRQRNVISVGDEIEFYGPNFTHSKARVAQMWDENGIQIMRAPHPMELIKIPLATKVSAGDLVRKKADGLLNLYCMDGQRQVKRI